MVGIIRAPYAFYMSFGLAPYAFKMCFSVIGLAYDVQF